MSRYVPRATPWNIDERDFPRTGTPAQQLTFLTGYAILAPSVFNTQPWKFVVGNDEVRLLADTSRWLPRADPSRRELFVSLGCALEHLLIAADRFGYAHEVVYLPELFNDEVAAIVKLRAEPPAIPVAEGMPVTPAASDTLRLAALRRDLFSAITLRQTSHRDFDGCPVPPAHLRRIARACAEEGISLRVCSEEDQRSHIEDVLARADAIQFSDRELRRELAGRIASPFARLPRGRLESASVQTKRDLAAANSAPVFGVLYARDDDHLAHLHAGQAFARVSLLSATLDLRLQPMSQLLRPPELRAEVAEAAGAPALIPQVAFRLGYAPLERGHTPRLAPEDVVVHTPAVWIEERALSRMAAGA